MKLRAAAVAAALLLTGCDEAPTITHVDRLPNFRLNDLAVGRVPVEVHGTPFLGISKEAFVRILQGPAGGPRIRFQAQPITGPSTHGVRMVLHFNPLGPPNAPEDCFKDSESTTAEPYPRGFSVFVSFCEGTKWIAHGFMKAPHVQDGDYEEYARVMRVLFLDIFREEKDR